MLTRGEDIASISGQRAAPDEQLWLGESSVSPPVNAPVTDPDLNDTFVAPTLPPQTAAWSAEQYITDRLGPAAPEEELKFGNQAELIVSQVRRESAQRREKDRRLMKDDVQLVLDAFRDRREAELQDKADRDDLTKLWRRGPWGERVEKRLARGERVGIVSMDLNKLKAINDTYGHAAGDIVLVVAAELLQREDDIIEYRDNEAEDEGDDLLPGRGERSDEFHAAMRVPKSPDPRRNTDPQASMESAVAYMKNKVERRLARYLETVERLVLDSLDEPDAVQAQGVRALGFGIAFGYAVSTPENPKTLTELLYRADLAMYKDKAEAHERFTAQQRIVGGSKNPSALRAA